MRTLSLEELWFAIGADIDPNYERLLTDMLWMRNLNYPYIEASGRRVRALNFGLAEISSNRHVQFIHQSVKDYFLQRGLYLLRGLTLLSKGRHNQDEELCIDIEYIGQVEYRLVRVCLRHFQTNPVLSGEFIYFNNYVACGWALHAKSSELRGRVTS